MNWELLFTGMIALGLFIYLVYSLLYPEQVAALGKHHVDPSQLGFWESPV